MRANLLLVGAAALVGVGLIARPDERAPAAGRIVVVRGGATVAPVAHAVLTEPGMRTVGQPTFAAVSGEDFGDPGVWATPAEFAPPEPAG